MRIEDRGQRTELRQSGQRGFTRRKKIGRRGAILKGISREPRQLEGRGRRQQNRLVERKPVLKSYVIASAFRYQAGEKKTGADKDDF